MGCGRADIVDNRRTGYQCAFVLSPISVPPMLVGYTVLLPLLPVLGYASAGGLFVEVVVAWTLAGVGYDLTDGHRS